MFRLILLLATMIFLVPTHAVADSSWDAAYPPTSKSSIDPYLNDFPPILYSAKIASAALPP